MPAVGTAGTYRSVTTDSKGHVTAGTNPTTLAGYGITDALEKTNPNFSGTLTGSTGAWTIGTNQIIKTSGGDFGIGVSPTTKLDVFGNYLAARNGTYAGYFGYGTLLGGGSASLSVRSDGGSILFGFSGTERMQLVSGGHAALGDTVPAWSGLGPALHVGPNGPFLQGDAMVTRFGLNCFYNGAAWVRRATGETALYVQSAGTHIWLADASGAAGGTFAHTEMMRVSSGGFQTAVPATIGGPLRLGQYTLATVPSAATFNSYLIDVTNATGGPKICRSNGSVWQIINTATTVF